MDMTIIKEILTIIEKMEMYTVVIIVLLIFNTIATLVKGQSKEDKEMKKQQIVQEMKIITELQNITSRQQKIIDEIHETNNLIYHEAEITKKIQEQTRPQNEKEQEEIRKKIDELNKMIKK